jgi:hypothetical protein
MPDINDFSINNFVFSAVEYIHYGDFIILKGLSAKDFNKISQQINVDQEERQFPLDTVETEEMFEYYKQYIEISTTQKPNDSFLTTLGEKVLMNMFDFEDRYDLPVNIGLYDAPEVHQNRDSSGDIIVPVGENLFLPTTSDAQGDTMSFKYAYNSVTSAGNRLEDDGLRIVNNFVRYTDEDGRVQTCTLGFFSRINNTKSPDDYPIVLNQFVGDEKDTAIIQTPDMWLDKDARESLLGNLEYHVVNDVNNLEDFVVGIGFAKFSNLVGNNRGTKANIVIHTSDSATYNKFDKKLPKGTVNTTVELLVTKSTRRIQLVLTNTSTPAILPDTSWAIVDNDNNLILAVNQSKPTGGFNILNDFYLNPLDRREGIIYEY